MKKDKKMVVCMVMLFALLLSGCQKTPDKSSVVSKAGGLSKELIANPLKSGEKRAVDMPEHWSASEKKSNDRVTISADIDLGKLETGNLPVVEMKNKELMQKELKKLAEYFAGDEELYVPREDTKETFQKVKDRIDNSVGVYANSFLGPFSDFESVLNKAIESVPETQPREQRAELEFHKKSEDVVLMALENWHTALGLETAKMPEVEAFFSADVGEKRQSHIEAERYDSDLANSSNFSWRTGTRGYSMEYIQTSVMLNETIPGTTGYKEKFRDLLNQYQEALKQQTFSQEEGRKRAEKVIKDLDIQDLSLLAADKILWFPEDGMPDTRYGERDDFYWQADLEKAKVGYRYEFTRGFGGISADGSIGGAAKKTGDTYTAPFPVEMATITVTEDGVKAFSWQGISEEVSVIAENVNLLSFDSIQKPLFEQVFYTYLDMGQPAEDKTRFVFTVRSAKLGYAYITAFKNPKNAWMVPTWFFKVTEDNEQSGEFKPVVGFTFTINAMDGGVVSLR